MKEYYVLHESWNGKGGYMYLDLANLPKWPGNAWIWGDETGFMYLAELYDGEWTVFPEKTMEEVVRLGEKFK